MTLPSISRPPAVSPLFSECSEELRAAARLGPVVDLACGRGRHALAAAAMDLPTIALDRNQAFLTEIAANAPRDGLTLASIRSDIETENGLPFAPGSCGAILVFRFLDRALCPAIENALAPGGLLLYETFTVAQRTLGTGPKNPAFLLQEGELPRLFPNLTLLSHSEGFNREDDGGAPTSATARLAARKAEI